MAEIRYISTITVHPASRHESTERIELTPWDLQFLLLGPIQKGLLFVKPTSLQEKELPNPVIDHLKNSLCRTLDFFPPLAGRLIIIENDDNTTSFFIDCNNAGAQFIHSVADHLTVTDILEPVFVPPPFEERVFHFTKEKIAGLRAKANAEMGTTQISSLQALLAHLWRSVVRCRCVNAEQEVTYMLPIGARPRLNPPLPSDYFGNTVQWRAVTTKTGELLEHGLGWVAWQMNKMIASQTDDEMRSFLKSWVENPKLTKVVFASNVLVTGSSPRFNVYGTDFGWGKPVAVRSGEANKSDGKMTVFPGAEEGSIDIEACLLPETLNAMGGDAEFMEAITI
ncbi:hypothetical protein F0562_003555 [Nyssa sinensis]|uniref:Acetyltransferase n=1 Tax=Nyssa sinensis TaxID=561372 RepID=A0A5J5BVS5_9ASTE|nr:hypothetical protein F0562_003555 [Nyssa sinensis]